MKIKPNILHILDPRKEGDSVIEYMKNLYLNSGAFSLRGRFEYIYNQELWEDLIIKDGNKISLGKNPLPQYTFLSPIACAVVGYPER